MRKHLLYHLALITNTHHALPTFASSYLDQLNQSYEELALDHPGLCYLARRMKKEHKSAPALMYRNQIVPVPTRFRIYKALANWRLLEPDPKEKEGA